MSTYHGAKDFAMRSDRGGETRRLFLRAANGDPLDGFRVFVNRVVGLRVLEVRESTITLVARLPDSAEAFSDSGEVLYVEDETHRP